MNVRVLSDEEIFSLYIDSLSGYVLTEEPQFEILETTINRKRVVTGYINFDSKDGFIISKDAWKMKEQTQYGEVINHLQLKM